MTLKPLYGILVTEHSYLLAVRRAAATTHAHALAHRVLTPRLPAELIDQIADEVAALAHVEAEEVWDWKGKNSLQAWRWAQFGGAGEHAHEHEGGVVVRRVEVSVPFPRNTLRTRRFAHISLRGGNQGGPSVKLLVPGTVPAWGGAAMRYSQSVKVACWPEGGVELSAVEVECEVSGQGRVDGFVQLDGVEEAMQAWDQNVVEHFVERLGLDVVVVPGEDDGLKPRLRLLQAVSWE